MSSSIGRIETSVLVTADDEHPRHSEASIVETGDGSLLLAWSRFTARRKSGSRTDHVLESDNDSSDIPACWSEDGGKTWHDKHVLVANDAGLNVMSPAFARLTDGSIGLAYSHREAPDRAWRVFRRSTDHGRTWRDPVRLTSEGYITGTHDRLAVLEGGRILAPLHFMESWYEGVRKSMVAYSDDHGESWRFSDPVEVPGVPAATESGGWEPGVVELPNGRVLLILRTAMGTLFCATSEDGGESWSAPCSMEVVSPVAPGRVERIPGSGDLLLVWNWHYNSREPMFGIRRRFSVAVSHDGGLSWPHGDRRVIEDDQATTYSYPSCVIVGNQALVTYYAASADAPFGARSLKIARIELVS